MFFPSRVVASKNSKNKTNKQGTNRQSAAIHKIKYMKQKQKIKIIEYAKFPADVGKTIKTIQQIRVNE